MKDFKKYHYFTEEETEQHKRDSSEGGRISAINRRNRNMKRNIEIYDARVSGKSISDVAKKFKVGPTTVKNVYRELNKLSDTERNEMRSTGIIEGSRPGLLDISGVIKKNRTPISEDAVMEIMDRLQRIEDKLDEIMSGQGRVDTLHWPSQKLATERTTKGVHLHTEDTAEDTEGWTGKGSQEDREGCPEDSVARSIRSLSLSLSESGEFCAKTQNSLSEEEFENLNLENYFSEILTAVGSWSTKTQKHMNLKDELLEEYFRFSNSEYCISDPEVKKKLSIFLSEMKKIHNFDSKGFEKGVPIIKLVLSTVSDFGKP